MAANRMTCDDIGKLVLRATLAILIILHGISKLSSGVGPIAGMLANMGMPQAFAYLVYVGELLAPALILIGLWTRPAALVVAINMAVAVLLVHKGELFTLGKSGGWAIELQAWFFFGAVAVVLLGAGRFSAGGKWN